MTSLLDNNFDDEEIRQYSEWMRKMDWERALDSIIEMARYKERDHLAGRSKESGIDTLNQVKHLISEEVYLKIELLIRNPMMDYTFNKA